MKYSDVDIALKCDKEIPFDNILRLKALFSDSTFPYMVDIIDLNSISEKFFSLIKDDLIKRIFKVYSDRFKTRNYGDIRNIKYRSDEEFNKK